MQVNEVTFAGFAGRDAETRQTQNGKKVVNVNIASTEKRGDNESTTWMTAVCWSYAAEAAESIQKGDNVLVRGKIQTRVWEDKKGDKKYATEIMAFQIGVIQKAQTGERREEPRQATNEKPRYAPESVDMDDIPF